MGVCCAEGVGNSFSSKLQKKRFRSFFSSVSRTHQIRSNPPQREEITAREHREEVIIITALRRVCFSKSFSGSANVETSVFAVENYFTRSPAIATHVETRTKNKGKVSRRRF